MNVTDVRSTVTAPPSGHRALAAVSAACISGAVAMSTSPRTAIEIPRCPCDSSAMENSVTPSA